MSRNLTHVRRHSAAWGLARMTLHAPGELVAMAGDLLRGAVRGELRQVWNIWRFHLSVWADA